MIPYIKFVNYPQEYKRFQDWIMPQPSPFVKTISNKEIYKTWSGEALINFKWSTYGFIYYFLIWSGYYLLLLFFMMAASPLANDINVQNSMKENLIKYGYNSDEVFTEKNPLRIIGYTVSIVLGPIFLTVEVRHFIYNIYNMIFNLEQLFGMYNV